MQETHLLGNSTGFNPLQKSLDSLGQNVEGTDGILGGLLGPHRISARAQLSFLFTHPGIGYDCWGFLGHFDVVS